MAFQAGNLEVQLLARTAQFQRQMQQSQAALNNLGAVANQTTTQVDAFQRSIKVGTIAVGAFVASTVVMAKQAFHAAASVAEMDVAMGAIEDSMGLADGSISNAADAVRAQGIEMREAQGVAVTFAQAQLDLGDASKIARAAQDLAVISQSNSTETAQRLTYAIQTGNSMLLRAVGINKYASEAYEDFAGSVGKAVGDLTNIERQQAITNMVLEEASKVAGAYTAAMQEPGKVLRSFPRLLNDMQIAFGNVLLEGFGPAIKASYDLVKQVSLAVREGGYLAPVLNSMQAAFTALLTPLTAFIDKMTDNLKLLNEGSIRVDGLTSSLKKFAPIVAAVGSSLALMGGSNLLRLIPGLEGLANVLGKGSPLALGMGVLVATSPELRSSFLDLAESLIPLAEAASNVGVALSQQMVVAAEILVPLLLETLEVIGPIVETLGELAKLLTENEVVVKLLAAALAAYILKAKLFNSEVGLKMQVALSNAAIKMKVLREGMASANATFKVSGIKAWGRAAGTAFATAAAGAKAFLISLGPMIAATAAIWAISKAFTAWRQSGKDAKERMEELEPRIVEMVTALNNGEAAALGFSDALEGMGQILTDDVSEGGKKTTDALKVFAVTGEEAADAAVRMHTDFDGLAMSLLEARGVTGGLADEMLSMVNATDRNGALAWKADTLELTASQKELLMALEELQDQQENSEGAFAEMADTQRKNALAAGHLTDAMNDQLIAMIAEGDAVEAYDRATRALNETLNNRVYFEDLLTSRMAERDAEQKRNIWLAGQEAEMHSRVAKEVYEVVNVLYAKKKVLRDVAKEARTLNERLAGLEVENTNLMEVGDELVTTLLNVQAEMVGAGYGADEAYMSAQLMALQFLDTAEAAGFLEGDIADLRDSLVLLDGVDPAIEFMFSTNLSTDEIDKQIRDIESAMSHAADLGLGDQSDYFEPLLEQLRMLSNLDSMFGSAGAGTDDGWTGGGGPGPADKVDDVAAAAMSAQEAIGLLSERFSVLISQITDPAFAANDADVMLEDMRVAAEALALQVENLTEAKRLQMFNDQVERAMGQVQALTDAGASEAVIGDFVNGLLGPNGALAMFAQTAGISGDDYAIASAALLGMQEAAAAQAALAEATAGMTPEQVADYVADNPPPTSSELFTGGNFGGALGTTTNLTVNLPPGVDGSQVVDALIDYATSEGATVPAPFQFVET